MFKVNQPVVSLESPIQEDKRRLSLQHDFDRQSNDVLPTEESAQRRVEEIEAALTPVLRESLDQIEEAPEPALNYDNKDAPSQSESNHQRKDEIVHQRQDESDHQRHDEIGAADVRLESV